MSPLIVDVVVRPRGLGSWGIGCEEPIIILLNDRGIVCGGGGSGSRGDSNCVRAKSGLPVNRTITVFSRIYHKCQRDHRTGGD